LTLTDSLVAFLAAKKALLILETFLHLTFIPCGLVYQLHYDVLREKLNISSYGLTQPIEEFFYSLSFPVFYVCSYHDNVCFLVVLFNGFCVLL
jgi:hypothetical protein